MERLLLPIFLIIAGFGLCGLSHRVTNVIGGVCGIIAGILMLV